MKPCFDCGHGILNNAADCPECGASQRSNASTESPVPIPLKETSHVGAFTVEILLRTLIAATLFLPLAIGVLFILAPLKYALIYGGIVGLALSLTYTIVDMYFRNQLFRGPLG